MFLLWVPFWACLGVPGGSKKGFLLFFLGLFFFLVACSCCCGSLFGLVLGPRASFLLLFSAPALSGSCFFFCCFLFLFCPRGGASCCSFFPLSFWGLCFVCFSFIFGVFFCRFFFSKGLVLDVGLFWGLFWDPGGL